MLANTVVHPIVLTTPGSGDYVCSSPCGNAWCLSHTGILTSRLKAHQKPCHAMQCTMPDSAAAREGAQQFCILAALGRTAALHQLSPLHEGACRAVAYLDDALFVLAEDLGLKGVYIPSGKAKGTYLL